MDMYIISKVLFGSGDISGVVVLTGLKANVD